MKILTLIRLLRWYSIHTNGCVAITMCAERLQHNSRIDYLVFLLIKYSTCTVFIFGFCVLPVKHVCTIFFLYFWRHESLLYSIQLPTTLALLISKYLFSLIWEWHIIITTHYKIYFKINYIYSIFLNFNYSLLCPINKILLNLKY